MRRQSDIMDIEKNETENKEITETEAPAKKKKKGRAKRVLLIILAVILALVIAIVAAYFILRAVGKSHFHPAIMKIDNVKAVDNVVAYDEGKTIKYNGKTYVYNENMIYVAFMGIDSNQLDAIPGIDHSAGQSDVNMLIAVDTESGKISLLIIPRDSLVDVNIYNSEGKRIGISNIQLCLSYAYGDGRETSCENVLESMERILYGIEIENYYALDLGGIAALNDAVGGVEVTCLDTLNGVYYEGQTMTLWGKTAQRYVQHRDTSVFNSDSMRRARQIQYAKAFAAKLFSVIKQDFSKVSEIYSIAGDYACTNFDISRVTYLASLIVEKYDSFSIKDEDIYTLPGEAEMNGNFMAIELDRDAVFETVLKVFYTEA